MYLAIENIYVKVLWKINYDVSKLIFYHGFTLYFSNVAKKLLFLSRFDFVACRTVDRDTNINVCKAIFD